MKCLDVPPFVVLLDPLWIPINTPVCHLAVFDDVSVHFTSSELYEILDES